MKRISVALAAILLLLTACGGGSEPKRQKSTPRAPAALSSVDPCSLLSARDLSLALGSTPPGHGARTGPTCTFTVGARGIQVRTATATPQNRHALARPPAHARALSAPGSVGYAVAVESIDGTASGQAQAALVKGTTFVTIVLTDHAQSRAALLRHAVALGRAAARRL